MKSSSRFFLSLLGASLIAACGGGSSQGPPPPPPNSTIAKASPSGDAQTGAVGQALAQPIRVLVTQGGTPQAGVTVTFSAVSGSVSPASATTDASGIASASWTLGTQTGSQSLTAAATGATGSPLTFSATANPGPAAQVTASGGTGQTDVAGQALAPFQVQVRDQFGNAIVGATVAWTVTAGGGSITPTSGTSNGTGVASATLTLGSTPGTNTAQATVSGVTPVTFTATAADPALSIRLGNDFFSPALLQVPAGSTVTWIWPVGAVGHSVISDGTSPANTFASETTVQSGPKTYSVTFSTAGTYRFYCSVHGGPGSGGIPTGMSGAVVVQ